MIADQYLGPEIPNAIRFDFDFTHRRKVSANAIATGKIYVGAGADDHIIPGKTEMQEVAGVTARQDQLMMESYAAQLRAGLAGTLDPPIDCNRHDVLLNLLERGGVQYLVVINDRREYDDRTGPYKAVMERLVPQTVTVRMRDGLNGAQPYDLLARRMITSTDASDGARFEVELGEVGGTIVALLPRPLAGVRITAPSFVVRDTSYAIELAVIDGSGSVVPGSHPLRVRVTAPDGSDTEYSHFACCDAGRCTFQWRPAMNDPFGAWTIAIDDLTAGTNASRIVEVRASLKKAEANGRQ